MSIFDTSSKASRADSNNVAPPAKMPPNPELRAAPARPHLPADATAPRRLLSTLDSAKRKEYPIVTGVLDYFPDAIAMVAHVSYVGNQKHNPGQPLHWARGKSADHLDCVGRHLLERNEVETDDILHMANEVWRSLAAFQEMLEKRHALSLPYGATEPGVELKSDLPQR